MKLKIKKLHDDAVIPQFAHSYDAGMDMFAVEEVVIQKGEMVKIRTGLALEIPDGYVGLFWDKSSVGSKGIKTFGGVIDSGYRGEVMVVVKNLSDSEHIFHKGDKVAQLLIQKVEHPDIEVVEVLSDTTRGEGGFGSTGR
jgi:dUTP pyrophosphatase